MESLATFNSLKDEVLWAERQLSSATAGTATETGGTVALEGELERVVASQHQQLQALETMLTATPRRRNQAADTLQTAQIDPTSLAPHHFVGALTARPELHAPLQSLKQLTEEQGAAVQRLSSQTRDPEYTQDVDAVVADVLAVLSSNNRASHALLDALRQTQQAKRPVLTSLTNSLSEEVSQLQESALSVLKVAASTLHGSDAALAQLCAENAALVEANRDLQEQIKTLRRTAESTTAATERAEESRFSLQSAQKKYAESQEQFRQLQDEATHNRERCVALETQLKESACLYEDKCKFLGEEVESLRTTLAARDESHAVQKNALMRERDEALRLLRSARAELESRDVPRRRSSPPHEASDSAPSSVSPHKEAYVVETEAHPVVTKKQAQAATGNVTLVSEAKSLLQEIELTRRCAKGRASPERREGAASSPAVSPQRDQAPKTKVLRALIVDLEDQRRKLEDESVHLASQEQSVVQKRAIVSSTLLARRNQLLMSNAPDSEIDALNSQLSTVMSKINAAETQVEANVREVAAKRDAVVRQLQHVQKQLSL